MSDLSRGGSPTIARPAFRAIRPYALAFRALRPEFGTSLPQVDLRPTITQLGLGVRSQGSRGTCSVFAVTFALEYMYGTRLGVARDLSEEFANHAANLVKGQTGDGDFFDVIDGGYREWGIVPEATVPYQQAPVSTIDQGVLNRGRTWTRFVPDFIKAWDAAVGASSAQLERAIAYLDAGAPVCFGGWWPDSSVAATEQVNGVDVMTVPPTSRKNNGMFDGHSVALVGYRRDSAYKGGGYFVFRNSWGPGWGDAGYGYMPFEYVRQYANDLLAYRLKAITAQPGTRVGVTTRAGGIDLVVTDSAGGIHAAAWNQGVLGGRWRAWWSVRGGKAAPGTPAAVVARSADRLDSFVAGTDGRTYTASWAQNVADGQWQGWWNILEGKVPAGGAVTAVARTPDRLHVFLVSTDGGVYTASWGQNVANGAWQGWQRIGTLTAKPGTPVGAVSRSPDRLDIFVAGADGKTYTAAWAQNMANGQWQGWWNILEGKVPAGGAVTAVTRAADRIDIFLVSTDGGIYTAVWAQSVNQGKWQGWQRIGTLTAKPGTPVGAVSRSPDRLDIFVAGADGRTHTAAWATNVANGQWQGWWNILDGKVPAGGAVTAVSRAADRLDVFIVSNDGGIYTAAWAQNANLGKWQGWWRIG